MASSELLTSTDAAELIGVSAWTLNRYAKNGLVPVVKLPGKHRRYRREDVEKFVADLSEKRNPETAA